MRLQKHRRQPEKTDQAETRVRRREDGGIVPVFVVEVREMSKNETCGDAQDSPAGCRIHGRA